MKVLAINGSPRKLGNTAQLLKKALEGAKNHGANCELIHLSALKFQGCRSCFACKRLDAKPLCVIHDELTPVLIKMRQADAIILGSPIYFMGLSSFLSACLERFCFPYVMYDKETPSGCPRTILSAFIYTMNINEKMLEQYKAKLNPYESMGAVLLGRDPEKLYCCDTWQYPDYTEYRHNCFDVNKKAQRRNRHFPLDLAAAYRLGFNLAEQVKHLPAASETGAAVLIEHDAVISENEA